MWGRTSRLVRAGKARVPNHSTCRDTTCEGQETMWGTGFQARPTRAKRALLKACDAQP